MNLLKLNFNQKVWIGFVVIIVLLSLSSAMSLFNLNDIGDSTARVNESAVPVLKQSNKVQIVLLKQAKLSTSGYNALNTEEINQFTKDYNLAGKTFLEQFSDLEELVKKDKQMSKHTSLAKQEYRNYNKAVAKMFKAKLELLNQQALAQDELNSFLNDLDDALAALDDITFFDATSEHAKTMELIEGSASRVSGDLFGIMTALKEINALTTLEQLSTSNEDIESSLSGMTPRIDYMASWVIEVGAEDLWKIFLKNVDDLRNKAVNGEHSLVQYKIAQVEQTTLAFEELQSSGEFARKTIDEFDLLLKAADFQFNEQQSEVVNAVSLGSQTALIGWIILILLASQNFNSMRKSIKKKMEDLAKLNHTGEILAATVDRTKALEEVLAAMHDQVGVAQGSVYLKNKDDRLVVKAFYPPKEIDSDNKPGTFAIGEGVLGKAAESQKIIYVPDTSKDANFVNPDQPQPGRALLCVPLVDKDILIGVMNFSGEVKTVNFEDSDYEFASAISGSLVTTIKNIHMREVIEEQNRTLEERIKARTAELQQKNNDIATMMANMLQGLFTIVEGGVIHHEYSAHLEEILENHNIANRNFMDLLFSNTNLGGDVLNQVQTAVDSLLGMDEMMFDFNSHLLVKEVVFSLKDNSNKILELDWVPIINNEEIVKIMVTVRDVTELRQLQLEAESQKQELETIGQILAVDSDKFLNFIITSKDFISKCRKLIKGQSPEEKNMNVISELFRNMHTVKGNARTYGFTHITDSVHEVEHTYDQLRKEPDAKWEQESMLKELDVAEKDILNYEKIAMEKLGLSSEKAKESSSIDRKAIIKLLDRIEGLDIKDSSDEIHDCIKDTYNTLVAVKAQPISKVLVDVIDSASSLAAEIGKVPPEINIDDGGVLVNDEVHNMLNGIFMHIFRNSIDHGIESSEDRLSKGKPEKGKINLETRKEGEQVVFALRDDGKGLAVNRIYQSAIEKGIYKEGDPPPSSQEISNLIFSSGFSTAEEVTEISGRGVGMDAVRNFLEEEGGSIEVVLDDVDETADFRSFVTYIRLNNKFFILNSPFDD